MKNQSARTEFRLTLEEVRFRLEEITHNRR
jgi:hypothetical protein